MEKTLVLVKPDGVARGLVGEVISRFEKRGLSLCALKLMQVTPELAARHYAEHQGKPFYDSLLAFITSGPVAAMVVGGEDAIRVARSMMGSTNATEALPGTIRGDFSVSRQANIVHGSDGPESAAREIGLFFAASEHVR